VSNFDLRALVAALRAHEVEFIVVGGVAVGAHGYLRATRDLEVVPNPEHANLRRLRAHWARSAPAFRWREIGPSIRPKTYRGSSAGAT
jgi:hypothetical protein